MFQNRKLELIYQNFWTYFWDLFFPRKSIFDLVSEKNSQTIYEFKPVKVIYKTEGEARTETNVIAIADYKQISSALYRFKYNHESYLGVEIGELMSKKIGLLLKDSKTPAPDFITFVPSDPVRFAQRGFNPPQILASVLSKNFNIPLLDLFEKKKHTKAQAKLNKFERLNNLQNTFELKSEVLKSVSISSTNLTTTDRIWLIDDVIASGSTTQNLITLLNSKFPNIVVEVVVLARNND